MVKHIPEGFHTVTPFLCINGVANVLEFIKKTFDETEIKECISGPNGEIFHAEVRIHDSYIMLGEARKPEDPPMPGKLYVYVKSTDRIYVKALQAGGTTIQRPTDMYYGDRTAAVKDMAG